MGNELTKDELFKAKSYEIKKNSKGGDHVIFRMNKEETERVIKQLTDTVTDDGIRLDLHLTEKETNDGARTFLSGIMFVKGIQPFGSTPRPGTYGTAKPQARPAAAVANSSAKAAVDRLRRPQN